MRDAVGKPLKMHISKSNPIVGAAPQLAAESGLASDLSPMPAPSALAA
jgi:hypothetical protein